MIPTQNSNNSKFPTNKEDYSKLLYAPKNKTAIRHNVTPQPWLVCTHRTREILTIHNFLQSELLTHVTAVVGTNKIHNFEKLL